MRYLFIVLMLMSIGCGTTEPVQVTGPAGSPGPQGDAGKQGDQGDKGDKGDEGKEAPTPTPVATLEGYYVLPNGGYADIYQDAQKLYTIRNLRLIVPNADGSTGLVPLNSTGTLNPVNGAVYYSANLNYTPATHNVKQDSNNSLFSGSMLTELIILKSDGKLTIKTLVNSSSGVLFDHTVTE